MKVRRERKYLMGQEASTDFRLLIRAPRCQRISRPASAARRLAELLDIRLPDTARRAAQVVPTQGGVGNAY